MSWVGLLLLLVGAWLAYKLVGALLKMVMFVLALVGAYWLLAPYMGWPTVSELFYVLGPDFGGRRLEEVVRPSTLANDVGGRVVDRVVERVLAPPVEAVGQPLPDAAPLPEPAPLPDPPVQQDGPPRPQPP